MAAAASWIIRLSSAFLSIFILVICIDTPPSAADAFDVTTVSQYQNCVRTLTDKLVHADGIDKEMKGESRDFQRQKAAVRKLMGEREKKEGKKPANNEYLKAIRTECGKELPR